MADIAEREPIERPQSGSPAKAQVDIWSTDSARASERFSYWRDAVCRAVFGIVMGGIGTVGLVLLLIVIVASGVTRR